jgi:hypothetical protein
MDFQNGWNQAWSDVATFLPKLLAFAVILVIGWIVAKALEKVTNAVLERVGFDRAVERGGVSRALERSRYDASDVVAKIVYYGILLLALQMAFGVFGPNSVSDLLSQIIAWLPQLVVGIIIVVVAAAIASAVRDILSSTLGALSYGRVLANIAAIFVIGLGIIAALDQIGVATTVTTPVLVAVLATIAGVIIVGVGGGLVRPMQDTWQRWLSTLQRESVNVRDEVRRSRSNGSASYPTATGPETIDLGAVDQERQAQSQQPDQPGQRP